MDTIPENEVSNTANDATLPQAQPPVNPSPANESISSSAENTEPHEADKTITQSENGTANSPTNQRPFGVQSTSSSNFISFGIVNYQLPVSFPVYEIAQKNF